jgi:ribosomal-protein-serine acetyltransferase
MLGASMNEQYLDKKIRGEKISLIKHEVDLAQKMFDYVQEDKERLSIFLPFPKFIKSVQDEIDYIERCNREWVEHQAAHFGIYRNSDDEYLGNISAFGFHWIHCRCEIGYWILGKFEGQGYMSEAVRLLENSLFEAGLNRIVIRCDPRNSRSCSLPKRLDYVLEGTQREVQNNGVRFCDFEVYSKLRSDL